MRPTTRRERRNGNQRAWRMLRTRVVRTYLEWHQLSHVASAPVPPLTRLPFPRLPDSSYTLPMKPLLLSLVFALPACAQVLQAIPAKTPNNCDARADVMEKWLHDWPNLARYRQ